MEGAAAVLTTGAVATLRTTVGAHALRMCCASAVSGGGAPRPQRSIVTHARQKMIEHFLHLRPDGQLIPHGAHYHRQQIASSARLPACPAQAGHARVDQSPVAS